MKRKDALWVMQMCRDRDARSEEEREAFDTAIEALKSESIFTADRPRGEWHKNVEYSATGNRRTMADQCSVCSGIVPWGMSDKFDFCPNCGADMRTTKGEA